VVSAPGSFFPCTTNVTLIRSVRVDVMHGFECGLHMKKMRFA